LGALGRGITRHEVWVPNLYGQQEALDQPVKLAESAVVTLRVARPRGHLADIWGRSPEPDRDYGLLLMLECGIARGGG
jgi:hypothetical protein